MFITMILEVITIYMKEAYALKQIKLHFSWRSFGISHSYCDDDFLVLLCTAEYAANFWEVLSKLSSLTVVDANLSKLPIKFSAISFIPKAELCQKSFNSRRCELCHGMMCALCLRKIASISGGNRYCESMEHLMPALQRMLLKLGGTHAEVRQNALMPSAVFSKKLKICN
ncbi:hypothetical protein HHK36_014553 [Tetracentron sinense]|uniref:Uncharacterized protein n=1 Tax=Tetracentron sinense TaxID=13715 RepID=A0A834Z4M4_TETSI|nr:hypothetical protein HHK36_014553 [Tetracentron sinense]